MAEIFGVQGSSMKFLLPVALATTALWGCAAPGPVLASRPAPAEPAPALAAAVPAMAPALAAASAPASEGSASPAPVAHYRCDQGIEITVRFAEDSATVDAGSRGREVLLRDAGGATPQQTDYSNDRMRAEFGLGVSGREALLRYAEPPLLVHCARD
jgi:hypothetical protein